MTRDEEVKKLGAVATSVEFSYRFQKFVYTLPAENPMAAAEGLWAITVGLVDELVGEAQLPKPAAKPEPVRVPDQQDGEKDHFAVESITVEYSPTGEKGAKVRGGKFKKFGVRVWPEVLAAEGIDLDTIDAGDYPKTSLTGKTAIVLLDGGKAKKVIGFK